ncbi:MAG: amino acid ABC transporter permease [Tistrella sp.]|nr:amino acid ABC transporter permease [Tistrella sp.]
MAEIARGGRGRPRIPGPLTGERRRLNGLGSARTRSLVIQMVVIGALAALVVWLVGNARAAIAFNGMASGFGFLWRATGWDLGFSVIPFGPTDPYWKALLAGLLNTLLLGAVSLSIATVVGVVIGTIRSSRNAVASLAGTVYVEIFRNVPMLVQLMLWYKILTALPPPRQAVSMGDALFLSNRGVYLPVANLPVAAGIAICVVMVAGVATALWLLLANRGGATPGTKFRRAGLALLAALGLSVAIFQATHVPGTPLLDLPALKGLNLRGGFRLSQEMLACVIALAVYGSAYIAEIIRSGFQSVDRGLIEASKALGLSDAATFFQIRLPLAIRAVMPTLTSQYVWLLKATTIGLAVGFADFFLVVSNAINQSGQTFELIGIFMVVFWCINYLLATLFNRINAVIRLKGDQLRMSGGRLAPVRLLPRSWGELRAGYFRSWRSGCASLIFGLAIGWIVIRVGDWAVVSAVWDQADRALCRAADAGACWSVIDARWRLILFGLYPVEEQWRSALGCALLIGAGLLSAWPRMWNLRRIALLWAGGFTGFYLLMSGGFAGLRELSPQDWGGLALTLFVFASVVIIGMPLAILLALVRRSKLQPLATITGGIIDTIRALPLLALIYTAAIVLPFALPGWLQGDKLYRVILVFALFFACYQAEILRSGFQALPKGQEEAAMALGLPYRDRILRVLLPQVFKAILPPTVNQLVVTFKETSLIVVIGFFEVLASGATAYGDAEWNFAYLEVYLFVALIYFAFTFSLSRYGAHLEHRLNSSRR